VKISVKQVLSESISLYKENFKKMAVISLVMFAYYVLSQLMGRMTAIADEHPYLIWVALALSIVVLFVVIIFLPKLYLAIMIWFNSLLEKNKMTFGESYRRTQGKYWLSVGCMFLMVLWYMPMVIFREKPFGVEVRTLYAAFVTSFFYTLFPMIAIEPRGRRYLRRSVQLIKGNYISALMLTFIMATIPAMMNRVFIHVFQGKPAELYWIGVIYELISSFILPVVYMAQVIVYRQLKHQ